MDLADPKRCSRCPYIEASVDTVYDQIEDLIIDMLKDRDTWKKTCELTCETFCSDSHPEIRLEIKNMSLIKGVVDYFYQKARGDS